MTDTSAAELTVSAPHRELLDQVLDKWSLAVLNELCERPCRFNELRRLIPVVTQKSLTATLRKLETLEEQLESLQANALKLEDSFKSDLFEQRQKYKS